AVRPAFFAAPVMPFFRSHSSALAKSPSFSASAFLQSIIPAPVFSRSSFTIAADTSAISSFSSCVLTGHGPRLQVPASASRIVLVQTSGARSCGLGRGLLGGLGLALGGLLLAHGADVTAAGLDRSRRGRVALDLHGGPTALTARGDAPGSALAVRTAPE